MVDKPICSFLGFGRWVLARPPKCQVSYTIARWNLTDMQDTWDESLLLSIAHCFGLLEIFSIIHQDEVWFTSENMAMGQY